MMTLALLEHVLNSNGEPSALDSSTGPGWKARLFWLRRNYFLGDQNVLAFYPGPALPPKADGSQLPLSSTLF